MLSLVHVSSLPPTPCGVAEYTATLAQYLSRLSSTSIAQYFVRLDHDVIAPRQEERCFRVNPTDPQALKAAALWVNRLADRVVLLEHEFKLYGGPNGEHIRAFCDHVEAPIVTTLHTVWPCFPPARQVVFEYVLRRSATLVVFSPIASRILCEGFGLMPAKVKVIPHGVIDVPFKPPHDAGWPGLEQRRVKLLSQGLMRPAKGIELALRALSRVRTSYPDFVYVICGIDHPRNAAAAPYRAFLMDLVNKLGLTAHVHFIERYLTADDIVQLTQACDVGLLPYSAEHQSSSGVLATVLGCARPVIATAFQHAQGTITQDIGRVVPLGNVDAMASTIGELVRDAGLRLRMVRAAYDVTRAWTWARVADRYLDFAREATGG
jgi:glycosyltransferase involved in cell wall biosynthesis